MKAGQARDDAYPVVVAPDRYGDGSFCYIATHPDLPGCVGYGSTLPEAKRKLANAREAYLRELEARGEDPPEPSEAPSVEWLFDESGDSEDYEAYRTASLIMMVEGEGVGKVAAA